MQWTERIESLKAGALSAIATGGLTLGFVLLEHWVDADVFSLPVMLTVPQQLASDGQTWMVEPIWAIAVRLAIALISGFLFGVTYRYIIRQDESSHLKSGAVLAFALVRGLARIDQRGLMAPLVDRLQLQAELLLVLVVLAQSWALFALARWCLDASLRRGWLQSFQSS